MGKCVVAGIAVLMSITIAAEMSEEPVQLPAVLELVDAQRIALQRNPSIEAAAARIQQATARIKQARSLYYPLVTSRAAATFTELSDNTMRQLPPGADDTIEQYTADLEATWLIFDGFGRKFRNLAARFEEDRTEAAYRESQRLLLSAVATAFYNVQLARANIAIAQADEAFNQRQLVEAQARRRVGTGSLSDVLNFEVRVRDAQTRVLQAQGAHRVALIALGELMGIPEAELPQYVDVAPLRDEQSDELVPPDLETAVEYAFVHRPDMHQSEALVQQADALLNVDRSEYFPALTGIASYNGERISDSDLEGDDFSGTVGLVLSWDVFTGGRRRAQMQESRALLSETESLLDQTALSVASEVRQEFQNLITAQRELVLQRETTQYVEQNRDLVEKEYDAGQGSLVRLNEAQRDLITQQSRLALAQVAMRLSWHNLLTATGEILEPYVD